MSFDISLSFKALRAAFAGFKYKMQKRDFQYSIYTKFLYFLNSYLKCCEVVLLVPLLERRVIWVAHLVLVLVLVVPLRERRVIRPQLTR